MVVGPKNTECADYSDPLHCFRWPWGQQMQTVPTVLTHRVRRYDDTENVTLLLAEQGPDSQKFLRFSKVFS